MYRTFLSVALLGLIFLTGCGGKKDAKNNPSSLNKASSLPTEQQAQLALKIDIASALESFGAIDQLKQQLGLDIPDSVASLEAFVSLPAQISPSGAPPQNLSFPVAPQCRIASKPAGVPSRPDFPGWRHYSF